MGDVRIVSASQVSGYMQCPLRWFLRSVKKQPELQRAAPLVQGSVIDAIVKTAVHSKRDGTPIEPEALFTKAWDGEIASTEVPIAWPEKGEAAARQTTRDLALAFLARTDLDVWVSTIEAVDLRVDQAVVDPRSGREVPGLRLVGILDFVERDEHGRLRPLEIKTAASRAGYDDESLAKHLQLSLYSGALKRIRPNVADEVSVEVGLKLKSVSWMRRVVTLSDAARKRALLTVLAVSRAMSSGHIWPQPSWACAGCGFAGEVCDRWQDSPESLQPRDPFAA